MYAVVVVAVMVVVVDSLTVTQVCSVNDVIFVEAFLDFKTAIYVFQL